MGLHPLTWKVAKNAIRPLQRGRGKSEIIIFKNKTSWLLLRAGEWVEPGEAYRQRLVQSAGRWGAWAANEGWSPGSQAIFWTFSFPGLCGATAVLKETWQGRGLPFYELSLEVRARRKELPVRCSWGPAVLHGEWWALRVWSINVAPQGFLTSQARVLEWESVHQNNGSQILI